MKEAYCSYEVAKKLNELGLKPPFMFVNSKNVFKRCEILEDEYDDEDKGDYSSEWIPTSTHQRAVAFLWEKYRLSVETCVSRPHNKEYSYTFVVLDADIIPKVSGSNYPSRWEATEKGLECVLVMIQQKN